MRLNLNIKCNCEKKLIPYRELNSYLFGISYKSKIYKCKYCDKIITRTATSKSENQYNLFYNSIGE